ncbi:MAG: hypothetical protein J7501_12825 [Bdellovibrio sp.]|nr:hypothetical protein [Bdellovibrio sp.]
MIQSEGVFVRPYANSQLIHFNRLSKAEQEDVLERTRDFVLSCSKVKQRDGSLTSNRELVESLLNVTGMTIRKEDLDLIDDNQFIEIYSKSGMHIFRSFNIFEASSYTFEDLCCRQWHHLYQRSPEEQEKVLAFAMKFFTQENPARMETGLGITKIIEKDTLEKLIYRVETKWGIPVFKNGQLEGVLTIVINWNENPIPQFYIPN